MFNRNTEGQEPQQPNNNRRNLIIAEAGASIAGATVAAVNLKNEKGQPVPVTFDGIKGFRITIPSVEILKDPSVIVRDPAILLSPVGIELTRETPTSKTVAATVMHPYNASTKGGSQELAIKTQKTIEDLLSQKPQVSSSYGGSTMLKDSLNNARPVQAPEIKVSIKTTSSGERVENGSKSLMGRDIKNVELATQRDKLVGEVVQKSVPKGTEITATSGELEFTSGQIGRLAQIGNNLRITGKDDLETAFKVLQQVNGGTLKNKEVVDMVGSMRKTEIAVTTTGTVDNIEHVGIPALIPLAVTGLAIGINSLQKNKTVKPKEVAQPKPPVMPKPIKPAYDVFVPVEIGYQDEFLDRHIRSAAVVNKGLNIDKVINQSMAKILRLQSKINTKEFPVYQMRDEYNDLVNQIAYIIYMSNRKFKKNTKDLINTTQYQNEQTSDFRAYDYTEKKSDIQNLEYMRTQAQIIIQMSFRANQGIYSLSPCLTSLRIRNAINQNNKNKF
jgi:hypothetical protein